MRRGTTRTRGQAMVEFAVVLPLIVLILLAVFDLGRGVYTYNGVAQAAREVARTTSAHPGVVLGSSTETQNTLATQRGLVPGLVIGPADFACVKIDGTASTSNPCGNGHDFVRVTARSSYSPLSFLGMGGPITLASTSTVEIPE